MVIGVAGRYCAGKSLVVTRLAELGFAGIDVDRIGHAALEREKARLAARFGGGILAPDGSVDRRVLGRLVFANRLARRDLERIVHPWMAAEVERRLQEGGSDRVLIDAALLFRMGLDRLCDLAICVRAPFLNRLLRAMRRDRLGPFAAARRLLAQGRLCPKKGSGNVDILVVWNSGGRDLFFSRLDRALRAKGVV